MDNRIYGLYKRIMKRDSKAIDDIETLDEAKEIIRMIIGDVFLHALHSWSTGRKDVEINDKEVQV